MIVETMFRMAQIKINRIPIKVEMQPRMMVAKSKTPIKLVTRQIKGVTRAIKPIKEQISLTMEIRVEIKVEISHIKGIKAEIIMEIKATRKMAVGDSMISIRMAIGVLEIVKIAAAKAKTT